MADAAQLIASLPHLSVDDLRAIHARAAALLAIGPKQIPKRGGAAGQANEFGELLYETINDILFERTKVRGMPYKVFLRQDASRRRFEEMAAIAADANAQWFPKQTKAERASMVKLYAELVLGHLAGRSLPMTWHSTIPNAIGNLPAIVDNSFPGYAESGMLGMVMTLRTKGPQYDEII